VRHDEESTDLPLISRGSYAESRQRGLVSAVKFLLQNFPQ
jgi:hypothetical protein